VGTWNVGARRPHGESLLQWLEFDGVSEPDVYVLGFQELVELSAKQVIKTDGYERVAWENLILRTLNQKVENGYVLLRSEQLVGACLCVFVKPEHVQHITNVDVCTEKVFFFFFLSFFLFFLFFRPLIPCTHRLMCLFALDWNVRDGRKQRRCRNSV